MGGFGVLDRFLDDFDERLGAPFGGPFLGQVEELALGLLDLPHCGLIEVRIEGVLGHLLADLDELPAHRHVIDDAAIILGIGRGDRRAGQTTEIFGAADIGQRLVMIEESLQRDRRGDLAALDQLHGSGEDAAVHGLVEMLGLKERGDPEGGFVVDKDGPEHGLLRLQIVRHRTIRCVLVIEGGRRSGQRIHGVDHITSPQNESRTNSLAAPSFLGKRLLHRRWIVGIVQSVNVQSRRASSERRSA